MPEHDDLSEAPSLKKPAKRGGEEGISEAPSLKKPMAKRQTEYKPI